MFNVNLTILANWLLPPFLRQNRLKGFLKAFNKHLQTLYNELNAYRARKSYEMSINGQVMWIERMLNDYYDNLLRRIYIIDVNNDTTTYLYNKAENITPPYIYNKVENAPKTYIQLSVDASNYAFRVQVPYALYVQLIANNEALLNQMKANINKYKVFGVNYVIQSY